MKPLMLLIAEKRTVRNEYEKVYQKHKQEIPYNLIFAELKGHIDEVKNNKHENWEEHQFVLPQGFLQWNFANNAVNETKNSPYQVAETGKRYLNNIVNLLDKYNVDYLGIGTDDDIEGSALASMFLSLLPTKYQQIPRLRLFINDTSEKSILYGLKHMYQDSDVMKNGITTFANYTNSGILRSQINFVAGVSLTRALNVKTQGKIKANFGLVKAPILEMVNARYQQFINFQPQTFYYITDTVNLPKGQFNTSLFSYTDNKKLVSTNKDEVANIYQQLPNIVMLKDIKHKTIEKPAPQFYRLTKLQGVLNKKYNMSLSTSLAVIEEMYLKDKLITYPRTESVVLGSGQINDLPKIVELCTSIPTLKPFALLAQKLNRFNIVAHDKRFINDKKLSAHTAITLNPNYPNTHFNWNELDQNKQCILYEIAVNNLAPFLLPHITDNSVAIFKLTNELQNQYYLSGSQNIVMQKGWTELLENTKQITSNDNVDVLASLEQQSQQARYNVTHQIANGQTKPLPLYTIQSLMDNLDNLNNTDNLLSENAKLDKNILKQFQGIGTGATRGSIIEQLQANKMIYKTTKNFAEQHINKGKIIPTKAGVLFADILKDMHLLQLQEVVKLENDLINIQNGRITPHEFQQQYFANIKAQVKLIQDNDNQTLWQKIMANADTTSKKVLVGKCPLCNGNVYVDNKFVACENSKLQLVDSNNQVVKQKSQATHYVLVGCQFLFNVKPYGSNKKLTTTDIKAIIKQGMTNNEYTLHSNKKHKDYSAKLKWDNDKKMLVPFIDNSITTVGKCPLCNHEVNYQNHWLACTNQDCDFKLYTKPFNIKSDLKLDDMSKLLAHQLTSTYSFYSKKNKKTFKAQLSLDDTDKNYQLHFDNDNKVVNSHQTQVVGNCPLCNHEVNYQNHYVTCTNQHCNFRFYDCPFHAVKALSVDDIKKIVSGENSNLEDFISSKKTKYSAKLYWDNQKNDLSLLFVNKESKGNKNNGKRKEKSFS